MPWCRRAAPRSAYILCRPFPSRLRACAPSQARALLIPLLQRTVDNLAALGPERALTGPVARGDEPTIAAQRQAVAQTAPHLLDLFDELVHHTRALASQGAHA